MRSVMFKKILIPVDLAHKDQLPALIDAARHLSNDDPSVGFDFLYVDDSGIHEVASPFIEPEKITSTGGKEETA